MSDSSVCSAMGVPFPVLGRDAPGQVLIALGPIVVGIARSMARVWVPSRSRKVAVRAMDKKAVAASLLALTVAAPAFAVVSPPPWDPTVDSPLPRGMDCLPRRPGAHLAGPSPRTARP